MFSSTLDAGVARNVLLRNFVPERIKGATYSRSFTGTGAPSTERFRARPFWTWEKVPDSKWTTAEVRREAFIAFANLPQ
jgi:hypothetical protein